MISLEQIQKISSDPHNLYVVKMSSTTENFCKIGITKHTVKKRYINMVQYSIYAEYVIPFTNAIIPRGIESMLTSNYIPHNNLTYKPTHRFGGFSECFQLEAYETIINVTQALIPPPEEYVFDLGNQFTYEDEKGITTEWENIF